MRIGIFGGSFDPIHIGHLWIAEAALETLGLDVIDWVPAATSPLKLRGPVASAEDRLEMLRLALAGSEHHRVDRREIDRGEISYTIDTVTEILDEQPDAELVLIIGSDSLATIREWHEPQRLLELVVPAVVQRGGEPEIDYAVLDGLVAPERLELIVAHKITMPIIEISSSEIRGRLASNHSIRYRTPRSVEAMIDARGLYRVG